MKNFIERELKSFKHAINGLIISLKETHLVIHYLIAIVVIILGIYQALNLTEWIFIIMCIGLVITAELFNTAIEKMVDYISMEQHPQAKAIKDISAGAVLVISIVAAIIGINILFF